MAQNKELTSRFLDSSGGLQTATSRLLMQDNQLARAVNARYNKKIGGVTRRSGYEIVGNPVEHGKPIYGANSFRNIGMSKLLVSCDDSTSANTTIRSERVPTWDTFVSDITNGARVRFENFLDKAFYSGYSPTTDTYVTMTSIDKTLTESTSKDVYKAPRAKYINKYADKLYASNVWVDGKKYPDRAYVSSSPTDSITFVNGDYKGIYWQIQVDSARYLKAGMIIDIYGENANNKKVDSLTIVSVDKANNKITFAPADITLTDRDEIYVEDTKGRLNVLWNTDYPNPDSSDFIAIPPVKDEVPEIAGVGVINNRQIFFTEHSMWKWDGANLVNVSKTIGTTSGDSIREVNGALYFLNFLGVWRYDGNNPPQLVSRLIQNYIDAINQQSFYSAVAMARGDLYKVSVGTLSEIDSRTTSTSTSSTSTSSTSSSTSSTSTSSTSTSSTSTSSSGTTSTSSTSSSTSSTSSSTSSTSTSSTSTSTTTVAPTTQNTVLVYDTASNTWAVDELDRNVKSSIVHQMHGYEKIYFGDDTGRFYRDETGFSDNGKPIPFLIETKRFHLGLPEETKTFRRLYVHTQNGNRALVSVSIDGGEWQAKEQLGKNITSIDLGDVRGRDIAIRISQNDTGEPVTYIGVSIIWLRGELNAT